MRVFRILGTHRTLDRCNNFFFVGRTVSPIDEILVRDSFPIKNEELPIYGVETFNSDAF